MGTPEQTPGLTRWPIEQMAEFLPGAVFRFCVLADGTRRLDFMTRGCIDLWELDAGAVAQDMGSLWAMVDPRDLPGMLRSTQECAARLSDWSYQWRIHTPSGRTKWLHGSGRPRRDADGTLIWHVYVIDQTDNLQAQEHLRESEARFRHLLDAIPNVAVQGYDERLICRYWNRASERLYGYRADQAIGRSLLDLIIPTPMREGVVAATREMLTTDQAIPAGELLLQRQDGTPVPVYSSHVLVRQPGQGAEFFCIDYDLSERQHAEGTRLQLEAQLRESQKMEALGTLAGGVAHDFNNIVAAILGNVELALDDVPEASAARVSLHEIRKAGRRARDLVQQILAFGRRQDNTRQPTCLRAVLEEAHGLLRATLPVDVQLRLHVDDALPAVLANATQIEQVVLNLATNALQAVQGVPDATVELRLERLDAAPADTGPDEVQALPPADDWPGVGARLSVIDNGSGMPPDTLARMFEPFFTTKPPGTGTGLGLAVVHGILREHGAGLRVQSRPGKGTAFGISFAGLPHATPDEPVAPQERVAVAAPAGAPARHVLYVDDDEAITFLVRRLLERDGYRVTTCMDGQEALDTLAGSHSGFDLCITDFNMPGMSGLRLAREIKAVRPNLPVAIASGFISEELRAQAPLAGVSELIYKPDTVEALCSAIEQLLARSPRAAGPAAGA